ncbi:MAG TPA: hypothetical protein PLS72_14750, partial [Ilumatobacteraceae bacterium]|nr:hypothetical protein [Ilumatobacteraceae bacterium]
DNDNINFVCLHAVQSIEIVLRCIADCCSSSVSESRSVRRAGTLSPVEAHIVSATSARRLPFADAQLDHLAGSQDQLPHGGRWCTVVVALWLVTVG